MIRFFKLFIFFLLIFNINNNAVAITGIGPIKFSNQTLDQFFAYLRGDGDSKGEIGTKKGAPLSFAVNPEGTWSHYYYCPTKYGSDGCPPADALAVSKCSKRSKARGGSRCKLFARGYKIVWGGANIKFSRKFDEQIVLAVFKENGWYEEFSNKPSTGSGENKYIQKKKNKKKPKMVKEKKNKNIVSELQELKKLREEGILTEDEFKDAKKKLLE